MSARIGVLAALTQSELAALAEVATGADVWGYSIACELRSVERKAPVLIEICPAMEQPLGHMRQPYFGAIATAAGRAALRAYRASSTIAGVS